MESVTRSNERIYAVTGDATNGPYSPASDAGGPCCYAGRILYRHAYQPAPVVAPIRETPIRHIKNVAYDAERWSLQLDRCSERHPVVRSPLLHVNGPAGICVARVKIKREDKMLLGHASVGSDHCVEKKRARGEVDNRRAGDAHSVNESEAWQIICQQWRAKIALPNDAAIDRVQCVHIIRFRHRNDRRPAARAAIDIKWLRVNEANDCAVKVQVARKIGGGSLRECRINVKTVSRRIVVKLGDVHLRVCRKKYAPQGYSNKRRNWK